MSPGERDGQLEQLALGGLVVESTDESCAGLLVAQGVSSLSAGETNKHKRRHNRRKRSSKERETLAKSMRYPA